MSALDPEASAVFRQWVETLIRRSRACALQAHQVTSEERAKRFRNYEVALGELLRMLDGKEPAILTDATVQMKLFAVAGEKAASAPKQAMEGWHPAPQSSPAPTRDSEPVPQFSGDDECPF